VVSVVPGERTAESVQELVNEVKERLGGRAPELITTDEYSPHEGAILEAFGTEVVPPRTGKPGRPRKSYKVAAGLRYATVHKTRKKGRVADVVRRVIFGTAAAVQAALAKSAVVPVHRCSGSLGTALCARTGTLAMGRQWVLQTTVLGFPPHRARCAPISFVDGVTGGQPSGLPGPTGPCTRALPRHHRTPRPLNLRGAATAPRSLQTRPRPPPPGTRTPNALADRTSRSPSRSVRTTGFPLHFASPA
jgi:hypothetical protein